MILLKKMICFGFADKTVLIINMYLKYNKARLSGDDFLRDVIFLRVWLLPNPSASSRRTPQHLAHLWSHHLMPNQVQVVSLQLSNNSICHQSSFMPPKLILRPPIIRILISRMMIARCSPKVVMYSLMVVMYSAGVGPKSPLD